jgi:hypothetical protein
MKNGWMSTSARWILVLVSVAILFCIPRGASSQIKTPYDFSAGGPGKTTVSWNRQVRQGFGLKFWMSNSMVVGKAAFDSYLPPPMCGSTGIGAEYPAGACTEHLFGGGAWFGAKVNGQRLVSQMWGDAGTSEVIPDRKDSLRARFWHSSVYDTLANPDGSGYYKRAMNKTGYDDDGDGLVDEDPLDGLDNDGDWNLLADDVGADGIPDTLEVGCKGVYDAVTNPDPAFDNYEPLKYDSCHPSPGGSYRPRNNKDLYTERNGIPDHGEPHVDEDGASYSASDYYVAATDTFQYPAHPDRMGLKVGLTSYSWDKGTPAEAIDFLRYDYMNVGQSIWQDVYLGWFGDADIGPVTVSSYLQNNYSAYDPETRTAYATNPVDSGSTPIGLTLIDASYPLDLLDHVFQWYDFTSHYSPGFYDTAVYAAMTGENLTGSHIAPNQSPLSPSDTRFMMSCGSFGTVSPGERLYITYALVSGKNVDDMLKNARRAHDIYRFNYFVMPTADVIDSGGAHGITIVPHAIPRSPWGSVVSYRISYGTESGHYTGIINSAGPATIERTMPGQLMYLRVQAVDEFGYVSAFSDEMMNVPRSPAGLSAVNGEIMIGLHWASTGELNVAGYNVYRRASDENAFTRLNSLLITQSEFTDTVFHGDRKYYYEITAVNGDGHEGPACDTVSAHLLPPAVPSNLIFGPSKSFIRLLWDRNNEGDLRGYNVYRKFMGVSDTMKMNQSLVLTNRYTDSTAISGKTYEYFVEAVDTTGAVSGRSNVIAHTATMDGGILIVNAGSNALIGSMNTFYRSVLSGYKDTIFSTTISIQRVFNNTLDYAGRYSAILWMQDDYSAVGLFPKTYPVGFKEYLLGGGKMLVMGRQLPTEFPLFFYPFLSDLFGIDTLIVTDTLATFAGANGEQGFPSLSLDRAKLAADGGKLRSVDRISGVKENQVVLRYHSDPVDSMLEGLPVGVRTNDTSYNAYYVSFPLYYLDYNSARRFIEKALTDFGIATSVQDKLQDLPAVFRLYQAYPNPFNPTTTIRYDIPSAGHVSLKIYDVLGREVAVIDDSRKEPGSYEVQWNAVSLASGVYFYRLQANGYVETKKLLLIR